jgi:hypothetical protein
MFKEIPGYENLYKIDENGTVISFGFVKSKNNSIKSKKEQPLIQFLAVDKYGKPSYFRVTLWKEGKGKKFLVHQLVTLAFIGKCPEGHNVNHIDGNKQNNHISNLEYVTHSENQLHSYAKGLQRRQKGEERPLCKLTDEKVMRLLNGNEKVKDLAIEFNVSDGLLYDIRKGKRWKHLITPI